MIDQGSPDKHAPGELFLVQRFLNTAEMDEDPPLEELTSAEALGAFLTEQGLMRDGEPVSEGDLRRALDVREGLRAVLFTHNGGELDEPAVERMNRAAARAGLVLQVSGAQPALVPEAPGVDGALARILGQVATAVADGTWDRLKACADPECRWAFYDHSKNRSGKWCSMDSCGNQHKARAYRARQKDHAAA